MATIHQQYTDAMDDARALAAFASAPYTVWRRGDRFSAMPESEPCPGDYLPGDGPIRPVATIDADGTTHK